MSLTAVACLAINALLYCFKKANCYCLYRNVKCFIVLFNLTAIAFQVKWLFMTNKKWNQSNLEYARGMFINTSICIHVFSKWITVLCIHWFKLKILKLGLNDNKRPINIFQDKNLVWNQYTLFWFVTLQLFWLLDFTRKGLGQQANIVGRQIVFHNGLGPATFGLQA